jgi:hypothetical protein
LNPHTLLAIRSFGIQLLDPAFLKVLKRLLHLSVFGGL